MAARRERTIVRIEKNIALREKTRRSAPAIFAEVTGGRSSDHTLLCSKA
jgi:hypothetical protein